MNLFPTEPLLLPTHNPVNRTNWNQLTAVVADVVVESCPLKPLLVERLSGSVSQSSAKGFSAEAGTAGQADHPASS